MTSSSLDILIRQQDYFWFLAVIGFAVVLVLSLRAQNRIQSWSWLPWFAGGNLVIVFIELVRLSQPLQMDPRIPPSLHLDLWLGSILAAQVWSLVGFCCRPVTAAAWAIAAALLAWLRLDHPWSATLTLALLGTGAFAWLHRARAVRPPFALLAMGLTSLWLSPVGPLTCGLNNQLINRLYPVWVANAPAGGALNHLTVGLRRWSIPGSWGLWVSLTFLLAAGISVWVLTVRLPRERERQEWKRFASLAIVWLVSGIFLTALLGHWARRTHEHSALAYARLAAGLLPPAELEAAFGPAYALGEIQPGRRPGVRFGLVAKEFQEVVRPVRRFLTRVEQSSPTDITAFITVDRDGWRAIAADSDARVVGEEKMMLLGRSEQFAGESIAATYLPPHQAGVLGMVALARAPLLRPDGTLIGWLVLMSDLETWQAAQIQVRMQAFAIIALGLALAVMGLRGRLKMIERDEARLADKTKTEFLARVSHELRTPIQSVLGYGELLQSAVQGETARARLAALRQHGRLMLRLVNDLLNLSVLQSGRFPFAPKPTQVAELVRQTVESLRPEAATKGLDYAIDVGLAPVGWHKADGERLRQVVLNLVGNAIKFTDRGAVAVQLTGDDGGFELSVRDTGPGITPDEAARLFKPFARLEHTAAKDGTGLGLALARALCESMGGGINVESEPGIGTRFVARFCLPTCAEPAHTRHNSAPSLAGRRIMVVDDNTLIRELFRDYLHELGAHCVAYAEGGAALAALERDRFDAAVLDLALPGMDGVELTRRIRALGLAGLRIVGVSAHAGDEARAQALAGGMDGFLGKPVELHDLAAALQARRPVHPEPLPQKTGLTERLHAQFRAEASILEAALNAALAETDWPVMLAKAHYLKNSADVLQLRELAAACQQLELAACRADPAAARAALLICNAQLVDWH